MHLQNVISEQAEESEIEEIINVEKPVTPSAGIEYVLNFHNLRQLTIKGCKKLRTIFSASTWRSLPQLSGLEISHCEELVNVVKEYSKDDDHINYSSIFPQLEHLIILRCDKLQFIFPYSLSGVPQKLKSLIIDGAAELKYVFGKYHHGDDYSSNENKNNELPIDLPALERLKLQKLPKMIGICVEKYYLRLPSLRFITLDNCQKFDVRSISDFMVYLQGRQLNLKKSEIEDCKELVHIIEDDNEEISAEDCFPNLKEIGIRCCNKLKCLFSISTSGKFQKLKTLKIVEASELEQVFRCKQDDTQKKKVKDLFPNLSDVTLRELRSLITICGGIDFRKVARCKVYDCPSYQVKAENGDSKYQAATAEQLSAHSNNAREMPQMGETSASRDFVEGTKEPVMEIEAKDLIPALEKQEVNALSTESQLRRPSLHELEDEQIMSEPTMQLQHRDLGETKATIKVPQKTNIPFDDDSIDVISKERVQEGPTIEDVMVVTSLSDLAPRNLSSVIESIEGDTTATKSKIITSSINSQAGGSQFGPSTLLVDQQPTTEQNLIYQLTLGEARTEIKIPHQTNVVSMTGIVEQDSQEYDASEEAIVAVQSKGSGPTKQSSAPLNNSIGKKSAQSSETGKDVVGIATSETWVTTASPNTKVAAMNETLGQGFQEHDALEDAIIGIQSTDSESKKQFRVKSVIAQSSETGKEAVGILLASELAMATSSSTSEINQSIKETIEQGREAAIEDAMITIRSTNWDSMKQSTGPFVNLFGKDSAQTINETSDSSVQVESKSEKPTNLFDVIPSLHRQSQISSAGPSPPTLGICEIFQLVDLKDGETALLAQALERYPQLLLPRKHRTHRIIAWSYRVLVDILVMLTTKTPYSITTSEKLTLEANLSEATVLGFDRDWVESVRAKVPGADKSNVFAVKEEIQATEAKLEAIDSQLVGLSEDRKNLIKKRTMLISAKDRPFGI